MRSNDRVVGPERKLKPRSVEGGIFGEAVERLRKAAEMTQEQLAQAADLTTNYISDIERGKKIPSLTTVLQIAHGLNIPPGDLLTDFTPSTLRRLFRR